MSRILYWALTVLCIAVAVHVGLVIFWPRHEMNQRIDLASATNGVNALTVGGPNAGSILGYHAGDAAYAFCPFDLKDGKLVFDALMPATLWSLTIYSAHGNNLYSVNSRQAGVDNFQIGVKKAPDFLTQITADAENGPINDGWQVETSEDRGLIVVWAAISEPFQRSAIEKDLARSTCRIAAN
jgi:uncharacterized membrane protein